LRDAVIKELYVQFVFEVFTVFSSFTFVIATVMATAQDVDIHSFDNIELKGRIGNAVIQIWALVNILCDWEKRHGC
jgi:hypothetical protein